MTGATKLNLRRFGLKASGGYRGRGASDEFARDLLKCFGWDEPPVTAEMPSRVSVVEHGKRSSRKVAMLWSERRVLIDIVKRDVMLAQAWKKLLPSCLQLGTVPQYVIVSNQRELHLYDLAQDRDEPRLAIAIDQIAKYSEAFPFLSVEWTPGSTPLIINVDRVSLKVAELVAKLYRSLKARNPGRENDVIRFTLQSIICMFAEDIGLLPKEYFTTLLYKGAKNGDGESRLAKLFATMSTEKVAGREIPYFNGGLFSDPVTVPLDKDQLDALTKAAEANWTYVDPHIFGSVFQGVMGKHERHAQGGHYTAREDIMRIVGPTIVEPWRARISAASTLAQLQALLKELSTFRVLDAACGSGNFLYVAFRELYLLETELLCRVHEYVSARKDGQNRRGWGSGIRTTNFYGLDINEFAIELAKTTLNIAKKIAFEERMETVVELYGQHEMEVDRSLPLDNLDANIICADALFADWPETDAIVGNPPFLGGLKVRGELGVKYLRQLQDAFPDVNGRADFCSYWFRRAHDHLAAGGRAGLVATNTIREGNTREASTDYVVDNGGTITSAVSSRDWPGEAVVKVSMVNWTKGDSPGPHQLFLDGEMYERPVIHSHLQLHADLRLAQPILANALGTSQGVVLATKEFQIQKPKAVELMADTSAARFVRPVAVAKHLLTGKLSTSPEYIVDMSECADEESALKGGAAFRYLSQHVRPVVESKASTYGGWTERWWQPWRPRHDFWRLVGKRERVVACSIHAKRPIFVFLSREFCPTHSQQLFAFDDDYSFGVLQSTIHWRWAVTQGSKIKEDTRYTMQVWSTFPWPQECTPATVESVAAAGRELRATRMRLMQQNGWSLRTLHQAAEVDGPHPLKVAQADLDSAVASAYDLPNGREQTEFLLELNLCLVEDEEQKHVVQGPGLPAGLDPRDPRWFSTDCIKPPPLP